MTNRNLRHWTVLAGVLLVAIGSYVTLSLAKRWESTSLGKGYTLKRVNREWVIIGPVTLRFENGDTHVVKSTLIVRPRIVKVALIGTIVTGIVAFDPNVEHSSPKAEGYFALDTGTGEMQFAMSSNDWKRWLEERAIDWSSVQLVDPQSCSGQGS